jgi:hypothetical protein
MSRPPARQLITLEAAPSGEVGSPTTGPRRGRVASWERLFVGFLHGVNRFKRRPGLIVAIFRNSSLGFIHQRFAPLLHGWRGTSGSLASFPVREPGELNATYRLGPGRGLDPKPSSKDSTRSVGRSDLR